MNNPTITVAGNDTGALDVQGYKKPLPMFGALAGIVVGYNYSNKHRIIGALLGLGIGGYAGKFADDQISK